MVISQKMPKLSKKEESDLCLACGECCKRYWITVLPEESKKLAKTLNKKQSEFLTEDCMLHVKLFPKTTPGVLTFPTTFFPKRIYDLLRKEMGSVSDSFFVVPQVVLRREEKVVFKFVNGKGIQEKRNACLFIGADNGCSVYPSRPEPCKLFPFIAVPGYREQYPFCELFKKTFKDLSPESRTYYKRVQSYFKEIDKKGFLGVWRNAPISGRLLLQDKEIGEITLDELDTLMVKSIKK